MSAANATVLPPGPAGLPPPPPPAYQQTLVVVENCVMLTNYALGLCLLLRLLLIVHFCPSRLKIPQLARSMHFYLAVHALGCALQVLNYAYLVVFWHDGRAQPDAYRTLYWLAEVAGVYLVVSSVPLLYLLVERCVALLFVARMTGLSDANLLFAALPLPVLALGVGLWALNWIAWNPLDAPGAPQCTTVACMMIARGYYHTLPTIYFKNAAEVVNAALAVIFFRLLSLRRPQAMGGSGAEGRLKNRIVRLVLCSEIALNILPSLGGPIFNWVSRRR